MLSCSVPLLLLPLSSLFPPPSPHAHGQLSLSLSLPFSVSIPLTPQALKKLYSILLKKKILQLSTISSSLWLLHATCQRKKLNIESTRNTSISEGKNCWQGEMSCLGSIPFPLQRIWLALKNLHMAFAPMWQAAPGVKTLLASTADSILSKLDK